MSRSSSQHLVLWSSYNLQEEPSLQSLCVVLQGAKALSLLKQREQSITEVAEVLGDLPGFGTVLLVVQ